MLSLAIVSLVIFYSSLMELFYIGFPDGMTTELGLMQKKTYQVYIIITGLFALFFIYSNIHKTVHPKIIKWAVVLFVVFVISMYFIGVFLSNTYDNIYGVEAY